ncbi:MAG: squalene--hopene cyclase [Terriglobia bacterium]
MKSAVHPTIESSVYIGRVDVGSIDRAVARTQDYLFRIQHEDGHWRGELEGDTILESEYILTMHFIGRSGERRVHKAAQYLVEKALPEGGWSGYPGGPPDVSVSTKAYFVLKLLGHEADAPYMAKARQVIRDLGGIAATNSFTRIYLAIFGQVPWQQCPAVPPEVILFPQWCPINLYEMSAWSRGIIVPLSIIWASKPHCSVPERASLQELWVEAPQNSGKRKGFWPKFFLAADALSKFVERFRLLPLRRKAMKVCEEWLLQHFEKSDGVGAIFPPIINSIIALRCIGYELDHPVLRAQIRELERLEIEEHDTLRVAPCFSPVWDTALSIVALAESGIPPEHETLQRAGEWLLHKEVKSVGDWKVKNPQGEPGGWFFEYTNEFFPDVDDTLEVITALSKIHFTAEPREKAKREAIQRALKWALTMQNRDGGWGSFDKGCNKEFLTKIPFADHNAMIDPSTSDITGRGLETLSTMGFKKDHPGVVKAKEFLYAMQEPDGTWYGRWGCNYIYGTWLALWGLSCIGEDMRQERLQAAGIWIRSVQNPDGGWGELPNSYDDPATKGIGPSTASQTAWALISLMTLGDFTSGGVRRGIEYLLRTQRADGSWQDEFWTGTGFPKVFYLRYHLYATYFPLLALGRFLDSGLS